VESKKDWGKKCPRYERPKTLHILNTVPWKIVVGNSIYDTKWGAHTLGTFSPNVFILRLPYFRFL
jgi:hypothetical protein